MQIVIITACKNHVTLKKKKFMWIAGISEKHYSKLRDLGISNNSI